MRTGERPRKCRKQRESQTSKTQELEEDDSTSLASVLRSIPLPDCICFVWSRLGWQERRALRATNKALKEISDHCVTGTCVVVASPACPQYARQCSMFSQLRRLDLCKGNDKRSCRRAGGLLQNANLFRIWSQLQSLKLSAFAGAGSPSIAFPPACFEKLQTLELNTVDLDSGDLSGLLRCTALACVDLSFVTFKSHAAVMDLGNIRSMTTLKMETCSMQNFSFDFAWLSGLDKLQTLDLTHVDRMCGSPHWRKDVRVRSDAFQAQLGAALSTMTSLRSIRLDAGEYGTVIETEGVLPDGLQLEFNRGLRPIEALKSLESLAMDFLLTDDGWEAAAGLPQLIEIIVEGVALAEPRPGIMTRLEDLTINRATPAQLVKLLPLPSLRRLHVLFITVTASTHVELEAVQADLLRASHLLMEPAVQHAAAAAASASSSSSLPDPPPPPLDIWAGLQLVAESVPGNDNDEVMHNGKQIGVGGLARSLQPLQHVLRTLCLQSMSVTRVDAAAIAASLPQLHELVLISCAFEPALLSALHPLDRRLHRLSLLYGCSWVSAAQVSAFCLAASASRLAASSSAAAPDPYLSPVFELEISSDSMSLDEQQEAQRVLTPYSATLALGSVRLLFVADRDLGPTLQAAEAAAAAAEVAGGGPIVGVGVGAAAIPGVPAAIVIGAQEPAVLG